MSDFNFPTQLNSQQQKKQKGLSLAKQDRDLKMLNSGSLGGKRLVANKAIDLQEMFPNLSDNDAQKMALGYCILTYGSN